MQNSQNSQNRTNKTNPNGGYPNLKRSRDNNTLFVLVAKDTRPDATRDLKVTVHSKKEVINSITMSLSGNYFVLKTTKEQLDDILTRWNFDYGFNLDEFLTAESLKYLKKSKSSRFDELLDLVIMVG